MSKKTNTLISISGLLSLFGIGLAIATLFGFMGKLWWFFDLFSHFRVQYMQLCLPLIGLALWKRLNKHAVALITIACLNYALVLPLYMGKSAAPTTKPVRAMLMNLLAENGNTEQVLAAIRDAKPDILLLEEVTPKWAEELAVLHTDYEYRLARTRSDSFGIMLLSKFPFKNEVIREIGNAGFPSIIADIYLPSGEISFIGTHPMPPMGKAYSEDRNQQLAALPEVVLEQKYPVLLIGDLNASPWSWHFKNLVRASGLKNSMKGFGFQPSWPSNNRFLRIPLDHVLHAPEISIHYRIVGGAIGSDHYPVIVDFSLD